MEEMRKIHVTWQVFEANGPQGPFLKKRKTRFQILSRGVCVPNFQSVSFFRCGQKAPYRNNRRTYLQVKIEISSTGCSPHVDFDNCNDFFFSFLFHKKQNLVNFMVNAWAIIGEGQLGVLHIYFYTPPQFHYIITNTQAM